MSPPEGTVLRVDESVRRIGDGLLLGGSPLRLVRLGGAGVRVFDRWAAGGAVNAGEQQLAQRLIASGLVHPQPPKGFGPQDVALVTPVKDDVARARRLLAATREVGERIVVDDGSASPVAEAELRHERPAGPAAARNAGWRRVGAELVAFVDADVEPEPGWLDPLLAQFADPAVAAVAPRIRSRPARGRLARYERDRSSLDLGARPAPVRPMSRVSYVPSAALVVRRAALEALGGFDQRLRFGEDVDLVWRMLDAGWEVRYEPDSEVRHDPRAGVRSWLRQRFEYGTAAAPLSLRHPGRLSCARLSRWSALAWGLAAGGRPAAAVAVAAVTTALFPRKLRSSGVPAAEALRLAGWGHVGAGRLLADAARRAWWPLAVVAALCSRRARWVVLAALLPCLAESAGRGPSWPLLRVLDDLSYGAGVWVGCLRARTLGPLRPQFTRDDQR